MPESCGACDFFRAKEAGGPNVAALIALLLEWRQDAEDGDRWVEFDLPKLLASRPDLPMVPREVFYAPGGLRARLSAILDWVLKHWLKDGQLTRATLEAEMAGTHHPVFIEQAENWCASPKHRGPIPNAVRCAAWQGPDW